MEKATKKKLRCSKCFITLEHLKEKKISDYMLKIVKDDGSEDYICPSCNYRW